MSSGANFFSAKAHMTVNRQQAILNISSRSTILIEGPATSAMGSYPQDFTDTLPVQIRRHASLGSALFRFGGKATSCQNLCLLVRLKTHGACLDPFPYLQVTYDRRVHGPTHVAR